MWAPKERDQLILEQFVAGSFVWAMLHDCALV